MAAVRALMWQKSGEEPSEDLNSVSIDLNSASNREDEDEEEESSASSEDVSAPQRSESFKSFERIPPVHETPWSEFFLTMGHLLLWGAAVGVIQVCWTVKQKDDVNLAFLPLSFLLVPFAIWHLKGSRHLNHLRTDGLQFIIHWMLSRNEFLQDICLDGTKADRRRQEQVTLEDQIREVSNRPGRKGGVRYCIGISWCATFFWMLIVGHACWPCGYLYLVTYTFRRCQSMCDTVKKDLSYIVAEGDETHTGKEAWIVLNNSNVTQARENLLHRCDQGMGLDTVQHPLASIDPHWFPVPQGAWMIGAPLQRNMSFNASWDAVKSHVCSIDCSRYSFNTAILVIAGLIALLFIGISTINIRNYVVVVASTAGFSVICVTGIFLAWFGWVECRISSSMGHPTLVFKHLLESCLLVAGYNATDFSKTMLHRGKRSISFESNFRHIHQVSRTEVWFGSLGEAVLLALIVAAHSGFRLKRMQTREARYEMLSRRPKLVKCLLENIDFLDQLPPRDRTKWAWTLLRVYENSEKQKQSEDLDEQVQSMLQMCPSGSDLAGAGESFWISAAFALVRALIPSFYRQFMPSIDHEAVHAVPEDNSLWMVSALTGVAMQFMVYLFVLFQIKEAVRRYSRMMQVWHVFDSLWNFPSHGSLSGNTFTEIVEVDRDQDGEVFTMLNRHYHFIGDFSNEYGPSASQQDEAMVNLDAVKDKLPTWWAWREYLIVEYTDKRVRLEFHLVVALAVLLASGSYLLFDQWKEGWGHPDMLDFEASMTWVEGHVSAASFQTAWDLLFVAMPVLQAISCAATMNSVLRAHLEKVTRVEDVLKAAEDASPRSDVGSNSGLEVGPTVQNIFRFARAELSKGGSATRLLGIIRIDHKTLTIAGTVLSVFGGGSFMEILKHVAGE